MNESNDLGRLDRILSTVSGNVAERVRLRQKRRRLRRRGGLLAAAAAIVGVVLVSVDLERPPVVPPPSGLDVASSRSFVVFPTSRPDITVVWLMD
jgi:hypothetical protein